jgi:hypothetical protein
MPRSKPARCPRLDPTAVRCRSTAGSWSQVCLIFWRMSAGTREWVMIAGRLASDSVPPRLTASLKICSAFNNLNAAAWPPTMSNENVEPAPVHCSRTDRRRRRPLRGEQGNGPLLLWRGRAGNPPRAARFCQLFRCGCSPRPPTLTRGHRHGARRTSWCEGIDRSSFRACRSTSSHRWFHPAQSGEAPYADDVSTTRPTPPGTARHFSKVGWSAKNSVEVSPPP